MRCKLLEDRSSWQEYLPLSSKVKTVRAIIWALLVPITSEARDRINLPQNGMKTPDMESTMVNPPMGFGFPGSHSAIWRSLIREKPVVAKRLCSPIQTALLFLAPAWPAASWTGLSWRTSQTRIFLSRDVVTSMLPLAFHDRLWTMSLCLSVRDDWPVPMSQSLIVKSPDAEARMFSAAGLKRTCPTFLRKRSASQARGGCALWALTSSVRPACSLGRHRGPLRRRCKA